MIAQPPTDAQIIRHTEGRDCALPDPQFTFRSLPNRADEIAIERELVPENQHSMVSAEDKPSLFDRFTGGCE